MDVLGSQKSFLIWKLPDPHHAAWVERLQKPWYIREFLRLGVKLLQKPWYIRFWDPAKYPTLAKLRNLQHSSFSALNLIWKWGFHNQAIWALCLNSIPKYSTVPYIVGYFLHIWGQTIAKAVIHSLFFNIWVQLLQKIVAHSFLGPCKVPHPCQAPKTFKIRRFLY